MSALASRIHKQGASLLARFRNPERYETGILPLLWYYGIEHLRASVKPSHVIHVPFSNAVPAPKPPQEGVAVILHCFYVDLLEELLRHIQYIPFPHRLYVSTDTGDKKKMIVAQVEAAGLKDYDVRVVENKGRDIAPKFVTFRDVYRNHPYFLHLHTKKSLYLGKWGEDWRKYLLSSLLGSPEMISNLFSILVHPAVGMVFPEPFEFNIPQLRWENNFQKGAELAQRLHLPFSRTSCPHFPVGSMFWGKTAAIQPLLDLHLKADDFAEEAGQRDGELEHAIERMIGLVARAQGLYGQRISHLENRKYLKIESQEQLARVIAQNARTDNS